MQQLSPQDAMFAYMERPNTPLQLGWLNVYDPSTAPGGKVRFKDILAHIEARMHTVRFFTQKLVFLPAGLGEPFWVDEPTFDLEYHVRHVGLPRPGDWRQLSILVARLFARPLDFAKPLWEIHVIDSLDSVEGFARGSFAVVAKIHHAAVDGISGVDVTTLLHSSGADSALPDPPEWRPEPAPGLAGLVVRSAGATLRHPARRLRTVARNLPVMKQIKAAVDAGELTPARRRKVPATRFSTPMSPHRVIDAVHFPIASLRPLRTLVGGATLNDVLLAIVGGGLRRYLLDKHELPAEPLLATCPISIRAEDERALFGNRIANMVIGLATDVADPVERLRRIREETAGAKEMNDAIGAQTLTEMSQLLPGALVSLATRIGTRLTGAAVANTTVTNVPGPQRPLYLAGARLESQFALGTLMEGMGVFHFIHSYCGEITLTVTADRGKMPDPAFYAGCLRAACDELRDRVSETS
ncbi:MAG: wax ester/triacylglycerol synthase family O-acyltransferase [Novosphingobium sp.]